MDDSLALPVTESSQVAEARRLASWLAERRRFDNTAAGALTLVVTELATNLVKHATGGQLLLRTVDPGDTIEVLALDRGPGMADVGRCLEDGYSTAGSPGTGLGAVIRQATTFDICSTRAAGTAVFASISMRKRGRISTPPVLDLGSVQVAKPGEGLCGDAWASVDHGNGATIVVADGLGHGPLAAEASQAAVTAFRASPPLAPAEMMEAIHEALRPTRGAAVAVAQIDVERRIVRFCGLGNICGVIVTGGGMRAMVSHGGIAGHEARRIGEFPYPWSDGAVIVLHSDGLTTRWDLDRYPGLLTRHPSLVAGVLYRDFGRGLDDVVVVVGRQDGRLT